MICVKNSYGAEITCSVSLCFMFQRFTSYVLVFVLFSFCGLYAGSSNAMRCEYYDETLCKGALYNSGIGCNGTQECKPGENGNENLCYVLWQNNSKNFSIKLKGCWVGSPQDCSDKNRCMETRKREPNVQLLFCCCEGDMCNSNMSHFPLSHFPPTPLAAKPSTAVPIRMPSGSHQVRNILLFSLLPFVVITFIIAFGYWLYRRHKMSYFNELPTVDPSPLPTPSPLLGLSPIQLVEIKAQGRFGAVWKAVIRKETVAVKIFPPQDKSSWAVEQEVYRLPEMKHENILRYIGVEKRGDNLQSEYWLITAYHEKGSLSDFLKANLVSWANVLSIADSIAKGLTHMHEEIPNAKGGGYKPAIAHRDFKSKNVLIKSDMTACIADFGLALIFYQGKALGEAHGQVGTRRYMAPEVLEGAIHFNRDSFLRIDMYACGLVLWEILTRCSAQDGPVEEYMLPFEDSVGQHPTLEDMQEVVAQKKIRPKFKEQWRKHPGMDAFCDTIEECWDQDAEARLSASCVQERINFLYKTQPPFPAVHMNKIADVSTVIATSGKLPDVITVKSKLQSTLLPKESSI